MRNMAPSHNSLTPALAQSYKTNMNNREGSCPKAENIVLANRSGRGIRNYRLIG